MFAKRALAGRLGKASRLLTALIMIVSLLAPLLNASPAQAVAVSLSVSQQPSGAVAATAFTQQPIVRALKADGTLETTFTGNVNVSIKTGTGTSGAALTGTTSVAASAGIATFTDLKIDKAGTGYVLVFSSGSLTPAESAPFNVLVGPATTLAFAVSPAGATSNVAFVTQPRVEVWDAGGNVVTTSTATISLAIKSGTGTSGAVLGGGTTSMAAVAGVATFSGLSINLPGTGYKLTASSPPFAPVDSSAFDVTGGVSQLAFTTQPVGAAAGSPFATQPVVTVKDALGNTVVTSTAPITLTVSGGPGGGTLSGTTTVNAVAGVATFTNLSMTKAGSGYLLTAIGGGATPATSAAFNIAVGAANKLAITTQPGGAVAGNAFITQPVVTIQDAYGNTVNSGANVVMAIGNNPASGTLSGTTTKPAVAGVATFNDLSINNAGVGYTLIASSTGLASATTVSFDVSAGATQLVFLTQPSVNNRAGVNIVTQPVIEVRDASGNRVMSSTVPVVMSIGTNAGTPAGTLSGGTMVSAVAGRATFTTLQIDNPGTGYTLVASATGLTSATSNAFNMADVANKVVFGTQPGGATAGSAFATQPMVQILDASNRLVTNETSGIVLTLTTNPTGATLGGTTTVAASAGIATFTNLSIDKSGTGYVLMAAKSGGGLATASSAAFNVAPSTQNKVVFTTQPSAVNSAGVVFGTQPVVTIQDTGGNTITTSTAPVTLTVSAGTLSGTTTVNAVAGVATFTNLSVLTAATGLTLHAVSGTLLPADSSAFAVAGPATTVAFLTQPGNGTGGSPLSTQPVVEVRDANNTRVTSSSATVILTIANNPSSGTLSGTAILSATNGVASFSGLSINKIGTGYTLAAASTGLTGATSNAFNITLGAAAKLAFTTQPRLATAGQVLGTLPVVTIQDAGGNTVTGDTSTVTLAVTTGAGTVSAGATKAAVAGVAAFVGTVLDTAGQDTIITATDGTLTSAASAPFHVSMLTPSKLGFKTPPAGAAAGSIFATQPEVEVLDVNGNRITNANNLVTLSITPGTGTGGAQLTPTPTQLAATAGLASFAGVKIDIAGTAYTLTASSGALSPAVSSAFNVAGVESKLAFTTQPAGAAPGVPFTTQPVVEIQDAAGNRVNIAAEVTLVIQVNAASGTLTGTNTEVAVAGVADFAGNGLTIDNAGTGYTLRASAPGMATADSAPFNVAVGAATAIVMTTQPSGAVAGAAFTQQPVVTIKDLAGLTVTSYTGTVTAAIKTGTGITGAALGGTTSISAVAGVATFTNLTIDKGDAATNYRLVFTSGSLTTAESADFTVNFGAASKLVFTTQPSASNKAGVNFGTQPAVTVQDANGNAVKTAGTSVTIAITSGTGTSGAVLSGTLSQLTDANGVATFTNLNIDIPGTGYTLRATSGALTAATSSAMNVAGVAAKIAFTTQPAAGTGGVAFGQPVVTVQDAVGNTVADSSASIVLTITSGTGTAGAVLSGTATLSATNGVASYSGLSINKTGSGYTLTASSAGFSSIASTLFDITVGPPTKLGFATQPGGAEAGAAFLSQPAVTIQDAGGNTVTTAADSVTVAIKSGSGTSGAVLSGTATLAAVSGVASYGGLAISLAGNSYVLTATSGLLTPVDSNTFNVANGAGGLAFTTSPAGATGGVAFGTQPVVEVQDGSGRRVVTSSAAVTLAITSGTGTPGAVLGGTLTAAAVNGVATFSGLSIDLPGSGYTLTATSTGLTDGTSGAFGVGAIAGKLAFTTQPSASTAAGNAFAQQPVVTIQDASGNTVLGAATPITVAITTGSGSTGATLVGTATKAAVDGVATFTDLQINLVGTNYTLTATGNGLVTAASATFGITPGTATKLGFSTQPSASNTAAVDFGTMPVVSVYDAYDNKVTSATNSITLSITTGTGSTGAALTVTTNPVTAVAGDAAFAGVKINLPGSGYTLTATATGLASAASNALSVAGTAAKLAFTTQPSASNTAATVFGTQPIVSVQDANGNIVTNDSSTSVNVAILGSPAGVTLSGTTIKTAASGLATYTNLSIDKAGTYTLVATATGLASATSSPLNVASDVASQLAFTIQPSAQNAAGQDLVTQPVVAVQDAGGNTVTSSTASITLAIKTGTGTTGAILGGTATVSAVNGVANFSGLNIDLAGTGYRLTATSTGLTPVDSTLLNVAGPASKLAVTTDPAASTTAGAPFGMVVTVQDVNGSTVTNSNASVTVAITTGTGVLGATLSGTATRSAVNGVATFTGLSINKASAGYSLTATSGTLTPATSGAFTIAAGTEAKLAITQQPSASNSAGSAFSTQPVVTVQDSYGNTVNSGVWVMLAVTAGTGSSGAVLGGTTFVAAAAGTATFTGLKITRAGTQYTLTATSGSLTPAVTNTLDVTALTGSQLGFITQPGGALAGAAFASQPVVAVQDGYGNTDTTSTASIALAIGTNPAAGTLSGTATVSAVNGIATFTGLSINNAGNGYTLVASSSGLTSATSNAFSVAGSANRLVFTTQPSWSTGGIAFATQPVVTVQDGSGNTVTSSTAPVTISITTGTGTSGAALSGLATVNAVNGVATFSGLSIDLVGIVYTLTASSTGLTSATSNTLSIWLGPAAKLAFATQPALATSGTAFGVQPAVAIQDAGGNAVTSSTVAVTIAITSGTGAVGALLSGTKTIGASAGVASYSGLSIDLAGTGYTLTASSVGLTSATSAAFSVSTGAAAKLAFTTQPAGALTGIPFTTQPVVAVHDANGNIVTTATLTVTLAVTPGTGTAGGELFGTTTLNVVAGVATFSGLHIDQTGVAYTLVATNPSLTSAHSMAFNVTAPGAVTSTNINLVTGWNLISLPIIPASSTVDTVMAAVAGVSSVWAYTYDTATANFTWQTWSPGVGGTLTTMKDGVGYWVEMLAPATLTVTGSEMPPPATAPPTYKVYPGWNLIGLKSVLEKDVMDYLVGTDYRLTIYGYSGGTYTLITSNTALLRPGQAYWVYFNAAGEITP